MRCKICDWDIEMSFLSRFPEEDYCERCETVILRTIRETNEREDGDETTSTMPTTKARGQ